MKTPFAVRIVFGKPVQDHRWTIQATSEAEAYAWGERQAKSMGAGDERVITVTDLSKETVCEESVTASS